jgi:protein gp37
MSTSTPIEWVAADDGRPGVSWNFLRGCSEASPGCRNCYAKAVAARFAGPEEPFAGLATRTAGGPHWTGTVRYLPRLVREPLRWTTPRWVFVNSMSDVAHPEVQAHWIDQMLEVIKATPWHTYIALTKRPERLWRLLYTEQPDACVRLLKPDESLPNLILGTSIELQAYARRAEHLLEAWTGRTLISAEPLLGPLDLTAALAGGLSWLIVGGESGGQARPCAVEWVRSLVQQARAAGVPCFTKQLGRRPTVNGQPLRLRHAKGGDPREWDPDLRVRERP